MSSKEHSETPSSQIQSQGEQYCLATRYRDQHTSGRAYTRAQNTLFSAEGSDLSAYRFQLDQIWHVAVLGQHPAPELDRRLRLILSGGDPVTLPADILTVLFARRAAATELGPWVERHQRPGEQLTDL